MRAILIDPFAKSVSQIDIDKKDVLGGLYAAMQCGTIDLVRYGKLDVFVDDEGLMKDGQKFFKLIDGHQPLAGRAVILESDDEGDSIATDVSVADVYAFTMFEAD